jgi:type I restriction enzyme S subunit
VFVELFGDPITNSKKWKLDKLKNKATFENGDRSSNYPSGSDVIESGVLFLSTKNIVKNQLDLKRRQFISEEKFASLTRGKAKANDLIITLRGTLGSCCIFKNDRAFINAQMMIIRAGDELVTEFLHSLLTNASMHRHLQEIGNGAAVQQLTAGQLGDMLIPIPPLSIQVQFKNQLNVIKSEIEKYQIALNTVLKLHSSLLHQSFLVN